MRADRIIVVEDDVDLREQVVAYLSLTGFDVIGVNSAAELYRRMAVETFSILILDLRLPDEDGLSVAAHVRAHTRAGIIMATARSEIDDRLRGLKAGADIYLSKPVDLRELVEAVRSLLRRLADTPEAVEPSDAPHWRLERGSFSLVAPKGKLAHLTANEMALLDRLTSPCGVAVSRSELLAVLGYDPSDPSNRNLDAALRRLRLKIEAQTGQPLPIRTVHTVGYLIFEPMTVTG
jgi:DNA-binding response OmpR family regulator